MITNERQYRITKKWVEKFRKSVEQLNKRAKEEPEEERAFTELVADGEQSMLEDLEQQLREYEALRSGKEPPILNLAAIEELPRQLIRARIAKGWSQKQLAQRLGIKQQQIQRYEASEYASANLARIKEVAKALEDSRVL